MKAMEKVKDYQPSNNGKPPAVRAPRDAATGNNAEPSQ